MSDVQIGQHLECRRCAHTWNTRTDRKPVQCPKCKSTSWDNALRAAEASVEYRTQPLTLSGMVQMGDGQWMTLEEAWEIQQKTDWAEVGSGKWGDPDKSPEEILSEIRRGWRLPDVTDDPVSN